MLPAGQKALPCSLLQGHANCVLSMNYLSSNIKLYVSMMWWSRGLYTKPEFEKFMSESFRWNELHSLSAWCYQTISIFIGEYQEHLLGVAANISNNSCLLICLKMWCSFLARKTVRDAAHLKHTTEELYSATEDMDSETSHLAKPRGQRPRSQIGHACTDRR